MIIKYVPEVCEVVDTDEQHYQCGLYKSGQCETECVWYKGFQMR